MTLLPTSQPLFASLAYPLSAMLVSSIPHSETPIDLAEYDCLSEDAGPRRKHQFLLGRYACRLAREQGGYDDQTPILRAKEGFPIWPPGLVGSLSHSKQMACCAVAENRHFHSLGIDVESIKLPRQEKLPERLFVSENIDWIFADSTASALRFTLLFSACEAIYKSVATLSDSTPHFKDVRLEQFSHTLLHVTWLENRTRLPLQLLPTEVFVEMLPEAVVTLSAVSAEDHRSGEEKEF